LDGSTFKDDRRRPEIDIAKAGLARVAAHSPDLRCWAEAIGINRGPVSKQPAACQEAQSPRGWTSGRRAASLRRRPLAGLPDRGSRSPGWKDPRIRSRRRVTETRHALTAQAFGTACRERRRGGSGHAGAGGCWI